MKKRHIVMIIILFLFALIMLTMKDAKNVQKLTCTVSGEFYEMESLTTLDIKVNNKEIKDMKIVIDVVIPEENKNQKQDLINSFNASGKMKATATNDGIRLQAGINSEYFKSLGLNTKSSYNDLKKALELQGFTCK